MKKTILCLTLCASVGLFASEGASSSNANPNFEEIPRQNQQEYIQQLLHSSRIFVGYHEPEHKTVHHTYSEQVQTIRHEKDSRVDQFGDAMAHYAGQTLSSLLIQDVYHAIKNYFIPNGEAAFQESIANLKLRQAQNNEKEREANIRMMQEIRELITIVRKLNTEAKQRKLSAEEQNELSSAQNSLKMLQGIMAAAA